MRNDCRIDPPMEAATKRKRWSLDRRLLPSVVWWCIRRDDGLANRKHSGIHEAVHHILWSLRRILLGQLRRTIFVQGI